ncbi:MAG: helix-turn-helix domain-containing protein [Methylotenera sp.]|nr:helix-turn-helix domain-containing protein [Methylotenera sp.]MDP1958621.1 helix-turn-helix domain-containing protein [Methylotenera sp.]
MIEEYTIGVLSKESGVNLETIRYYEKVNLLPKPPRSASGYRRYDDNAIKRLRFIRRGRELGFGIDEIKTLLELADHPDQTCSAADKLAQMHLTEVEAKIKDLIAMREVLTQIVACQSHTAEHCRLIETLDQRTCCNHD